MNKEIILLLSKFVINNSNNEALNYILLDKDKLVAINGFAMLIIELKKNSNIKILLDVKKKSENGNIYEFPVNTELVGKYPDYKKFLVKSDIKALEEKIVANTKEIDLHAKNIKASYVIYKIANSLIFKIVSKKVTSKMYFNVETIFDFLTFDKIYLNNEFNCKCDDNKFQLDGEFEIYSERYKFTYVQMLMK